MSLVCVKGGWVGSGQILILDLSTFKGARGGVKKNVEIEIEPPKCFRLIVRHEA